MGRKYNCPYCDVWVQENPSALRLHRAALPHQRARAMHYQRYKDPETILAEERHKRPCLRSQQGTCNFGAMCRFSHYTREQIRSLEERVASKSRQQPEPPTPIAGLYERLTEKSQALPKDGATLLYDKDGHTVVCPWTYPSLPEHVEDALPPSLKRIKLEDFEDLHIPEWG